MSSLIPVFQSLLRYVCCIRVDIDNLAEIVANFIASGSRNQENCDGMAACCGCIGGEQRIHGRAHGESSEQESDWERRGPNGSLYCSDEVGTRWIPRVRGFGQTLALSHQ
jgi:hypothetical protein